MLDFPTMSEPASAIILSDSEPPARRRAPYRLVTRQGREFVKAMAASPDADPEAIARSVGYRKDGAGRRLITHLADLIQSERDRLWTRDHMHLPEALSIIAQLARAADDPKIKLAALRTIIVDVEGSIKQLPPEERASMTRQLEELVAAMKGAAPGRTARASATITLESAPADEKTKG